MVFSRLKVLYAFLYSGGLSHAPRRAFSCPYWSYGCFRGREASFRRFGYPSRAGERLPGLSAGVWRPVSVPLQSVALWVHSNPCEGDSSNEYLGRINARICGPGRLIRDLFSGWDIPQMFLFFSGTQPISRSLFPPNAPKSKYTPLSSYTVSISA